MRFVCCSNGVLQVWNEYKVLEDRVPNALDVFVLVGETVWPLPASWFPASSVIEARL